MVGQIIAEKGGIGCSRFPQIISQFQSTYRMTNSQRLAIVRSSLLRWLEEHHDAAANDLDAFQASSSDNAITSESILVRNDFFCGRRFRTATHNAVWFIEEDQLKIYQNDGQLLAVLTGTEIDQLCQPNDPARIIAFPAASDKAAPARKAA